MEGGIGIAPDIGLNVASTAQEGKEISQEDLVRVSESMRKAAQIGGQIKDDQQKSGQLARFLEILFNEVKSDVIWELLVDLCTKPDSTGKTTTLSLHELIAFFVPFFSTEIAHLGLQNIVIGVPDVDNVQIDGYSAYVAELRKRFPFIHDMDIEKVSMLSVELLEYFGCVMVEPEKKQETIATVKGFISMAGL